MFANRVPEASHDCWWAEATHILPRIALPRIRSFLFGLQSSSPYCSVSFLPFWSASCPSYSVCRSVSSASSALGFSFVVLAVLSALGSPALRRVFLCLALLPYVVFVGSWHSLRICLYIYVLSAPTGFFFFSSLIHSVFHSPCSPPVDLYTF